VGCNCGSNKKRVHYQVTLPNGSKQTYQSVTEAQAACKGCPIKAVPAP